MIGFSALALSGCTFDEGLRERDITGVVRIPVEALTTLELVDPDGTPIMQDGFTVDADGNPVLDITEQYVGIISGYGNTLGTVASWAGPKLVATEMQAEMQAEICPRYSRAGGC